MKKSLLMALLFVCGVASAKTKEATQVTIEQPVDNYPYMTDQEFEAAKKYAKEASKRKVARVDAIDENVALSPEARRIRDLLIGTATPNNAPTKFLMDFKTNEKGVQTAAELARLIDELNNPDLYFKRDKDGKMLPPTDKTLPQDAQFLASLLASLKPYQGITVRAKALIEDYKVLHAMVVTTLRTAGTGINVFLPTDQWKAGFKYVTEPYVGLASAKFIKNDEDFRRFMGTEVLQSNMLLSSRLTNLNFASKPIFFDNKIAYATANFVADEDRFIQLGEAERHAALGAALLARSGIYSAISYSWKGLFRSLQNTMTKVYGFEQVFNVEGATARRRTQVIREQYGTLFMKTGEAIWAMPFAHRSLQEGFKHVELSWDQLQNDQNNRDAFRNLMDPRAFMPFARIINTSLSNVRAIVRGEPVVSALVGGETVRFDIKNFFSGSGSPQNLLDFLPTDFQGGCKEFVPRGRPECVTDIASKTGIGYRNYLEGSPTKWNMSIYGKYFPDINAKNNNGSEQVQSAARILSQSWGGWIIGVPLAAMVL